MNREERIKVLQDIVKIKSVNDNEKDVADYANNEGKVLGLSGHQDVVAAGDENEWKFPPFSGHIHDGKLYGRGSTDMKSDLAALAIAMIELKNKEADFNGTIRFIATVGEEVGALGSTLLAKEGYADDLDGLLIAEPVDVAGYTHKGFLNYTVVSHGKSSRSSMPDERINSITNMSRFIQRYNEEFSKVTADYTGLVKKN